MNRIPDTELEPIEELLLSGKSAREIARITGHHRDTICKLRKTLVEVIAELCNPPLVCMCGGAHGHKGWCRERLAQSPRRQEFLRHWHQTGTNPRGALTSGPRR